MLSKSSLSPSRFLAVLAIAFTGLLLGGCGINNIPTYEQDAKAKWSDVLNQYKRRADLIPNLVDTVKGFADQEKSVLTEVTEARAKATSVQLPVDKLSDPAAMKAFQDAQGALTGALGRLLVTVEKYPDIKSGQNFIALQIGTRGYRKPHRHRAARLHRSGARLQYRIRRPFQAAGGRPSCIRPPRRWRPSTSRPKSRRSQGRLPEEVGFRAGNPGTSAP